jgi:hypothetical protein
MSTREQQDLTNYALISQQHLLSSDAGELTAPRQIFPCRFGPVSLVFMSQYSFINLNVFNA